VGTERENIVEASLELLEGVRNETIGKSLYGEGNASDKIVEVLTNR